MSSAHLAIDLGASSGRAVLGSLDGKPTCLEIVEVHRFEHRACSTPTGPVWDLTGMWSEVVMALRASAARCREQGRQLTSVGVDTWGVDWVLVGRGGELIALPHCYRDPRNEAACRRVLEIVGGREILYHRTGIQLMPFNTLFQLEAARAAEPRLFDAAYRLLFLPDLFHYWLSGEIAVERTIASTSAMLSLATNDWDRELVELIGIDADLLGPIVEPGTQIGTLRNELADEAGIPRGVRVIAPASHDTASAVAAVPVVRSAGWGYLSSGTWSLLGAELPAPLATTATERAPFTNEGGVAGTVRFLKNIAGLWLVQELRRELMTAGKRYSFADLDAAAATADPFRTLIDPNDPRFAAPGAMTPRIAKFAAETGQPAPETVGQYVRCCLESLALCYRATADELAGFMDAPLAALYIVGGGSKNRLLNQMTADAHDCEMWCGPVEATAIGNALVQAMGCGGVGSLHELREIVARSFPAEKVARSNDASRWAVARQRYRVLLKSRATAQQS